MRKGKWDRWILIGVLLRQLFSRYSYGGGSYDKLPNFDRGKVDVTGDEYEESQLIGTGRGGWFMDMNGDVGKVSNLPSSDSADIALCGEGGTRYAGGKGKNPGTLLAGGDADYGGAGGGGIYGGGSGFVCGGGGGGSSGCLVDPTKDTPIEVFNPPLGMGNLEYGLEINDTNSDITDTGKILFALNTEWMDYYEYIYDKPWYDVLAWEQYISIREKANGNGFILISKVNEKLKFDRLFGFYGLDRVIYYSDEEQELDFQAGVYRVILYGACGQSRYQWMRWDDTMCGGFGGVCVCDLKFRGNSRLYAHIGKKGDSNKSSYDWWRPLWNGGGEAQISGGIICTAGGGATDLRLLSNKFEGSGTLESRVAVAGGGGGIYVTGTEPDEDFGAFTPDRYINNHYFKVPPRVDIKDVEDKEHKWINHCTVNDLSIINVKINNTVLDSLHEDTLSNVVIKIEDGKEGVLAKEVIVDNSGKIIEAVFELSDVYVENTQTHGVTIEVLFDTDRTVYIPKDGVTIKVSTQIRENETFNIYNNPIFLKLCDKISLKDICTYVEVKIEDKLYKINACDYIKLRDGLKVDYNTVINVYLTAVDKICLRDEVGVDSKIIMSYLIKIIDELKLIDGADTKKSQGGDFVIKALERLKLQDTLSVELREKVELIIKALDTIKLKDVNIEEVKNIVNKFIGASEEISLADYNKLVTEVISKSKHKNKGKIGVGDSVKVRFVEMG